ncbi:MAG: hypothetical protein ACT4QA_23075 [Panacagrimonas sp.]
MADLESTAEVGRKHTEMYVRELVRHQYVRLVQAQKRGGLGGQAAVYQLLRDTGPHAPRIGKQGLLDPNLVPAKPEPGDEPVTLKRRDYDRALLCVRACAGMSDEEIRVKAGVQPGSPRSSCSLCGVAQ